MEEFDNRVRWDTMANLGGDLTMSPQTNDTVSQMLGEHGARLNSLEKTLDSVSTDVHAIRKAMDEFRGAWRVAIWAAGILGSVITFVVTHVLSLSATPSK